MCGLVAALRKLLHRLFALFFFSSGYEPEDAVVLLRSDLSYLTFPQAIGPRNRGPGPSAGAPADGPKAVEGYAIESKYLGLFDYLLCLLDALDAATVVGDSSTAYR